MYNIKIFPINEKRTESLDIKIGIYSKDIGMEFTIEKSTILNRKNGEKEILEGAELKIRKSIINIGQKEKYKYFGILEPDTIKQAEKEKKDRVSQKNKKNYSKPNSTVKISSKG